jgi:hypothetical protein
VGLEKLSQATVAPLVLIGGFAGQRSNGKYESNCSAWATIEKNLNQVFNLLKG